MQMSLGHDHELTSAHEETEKSFLEEEKLIEHKLDAVVNEVEIVVDMVRDVSKQV